MTDSNEAQVEILPTARRASSRRVYSVAEKQQIVEESLVPGSRISAVARKYKLSPSLVFRWRKRMDDGSRSGLGAGEAVVPESELREANTRIRELERLLGKKTLEVEILRDAVELVRSKKVMLRSLLPSRLRGGR